MDVPGRDRNGEGVRRGGERKGGERTKCLELRSISGAMWKPSAEETPRKL